VSPTPAKTIVGNRTLTVTTCDAALVKVNELGLTVKNCRNGFFPRATATASAAERLCGFAGRAVPGLPSCAVLCAACCASPGAPAAL
jgi:hypothetical protein